MGVPEVEYSETAEDTRRRAVALGEAVKVGTRCGWGEDGILAAARKFDAFLQGGDG